MALSNLVRNFTTESNNDGDVAERREFVMPVRDTFLEQTLTPGSFCARFK